MTRSVIQIRVSPEQKAVIGAKADAAGLGVSEWLRLLALGELAVGARVTTSDGSPAADRVEDLRVDADRVDLVLAEPPRYRCRCPKDWADVVMCPDCGYRAR